MPRSSPFTLPVALFAAALLLPSPGAAQQEGHTVVRGNTLWDLAASVYGDPWQWPRIWEANRDRVSDPDRIYPGQVLRIPEADGTVREIVVQAADPDAEPGAPDAARPLPGARAEPAADDRPAGGLVAETGTDRPGRLGGAAPAAEPQVAPPPLVLPAVQTDVVTGAPFLVPEGEAAPAVARVGDFVEPSRGSEFHAELYQPLVVEAVQGRLAPGTRLQAYRQAATIPGVGRVARPTGIVVIVGAAAEGATGEAHTLYDALRIGDLLRPLPAGGSPAGVEAVPVTGGSEARVVGTAVPQSLPSVGDHVFLDVGRGTTSIGDEFVSIAPAGEAAAPVGRLQIVAVQEGFATARVVSLVEPAFQPGLLVRMDRRMPAR